MPVNTTQAPPIRLQPMPPPTPATTAPSSTTATPDSLLGDESPLLRFVPADKRDLQLVAEAMGPVGTSKPLDAETEASAVRVLDTMDRVIGEGIHAIDLTGSDDGPLRPDEARVALEMVDV